MPRALNLTLNNKKKVEEDPRNSEIFLSLNTTSLICFFDDCEKTRGSYRCLVAGKTNVLKFLLDPFVDVVPWANLGWRVLVLAMSGQTR